MAGQYLFYLLPALYMQCLDETLYMYFTALEKTTMLLIMDLGKIPLHYFVCHIFVVKMELGVLGVALAMNVVFFVKLIVIWIVISYQKRRQQVLKESMFFSFGAETLSGFKEFLILASAGLILACLEWWVTEALTLLACYLGTEALAAAVIVNTLSMLMSHLTMGFSFTLSAMIGAALGKGDIKSAKKIAVTASLSCYFYVILCVAFSIMFS